MYIILVFYPHELQRSGASRIEGVHANPLYTD